MVAFEEEEAKGRGSFEQKFPEDGGGEASKARRRKEERLNRPLPLTTVCFLFFELLITGYRVVYLYLDISIFIQ